MGVWIPMLTLVEITLADILEPIKKVEHINTTGGARNIVFIS